MGSGSLACARTTTNGFATSLQNFCKALRIPPIPIPPLRYPQNVAVAFEQAEEAARSRGMELLLVKQPGKPIMLVARRYHDENSHCLFFIPLQPIFRLLQQKRKAAAHLLLSVAAYLYHSGVSHYDEGTIVEDMHCFMKDSMSDIEEEGEYEMISEELNEIDHIGKELYTMLKDKKHLQYFSRRMKRPLIGDPAEIQIMRVAQQAFHLFSAYPGKRVQKAASKVHIQHFLTYGESDELDATKLYWERYVSFCWSTTGLLFKYGEDYIQSLLEDYSVQEFPYAECSLDAPITDISLALDFEEKFFELMDDFAYLLNNQL